MKRATHGRCRLTAVACIGVACALLATACGSGDDDTSDPAFASVDESSEDSADEAQVGEGDDGGEGDTSPGQTSEGEEGAESPERSELGSGEGEANSSSEDPDGQQPADAGASGPEPTDDPPVVEPTGPTAPLTGLLTTDASLSERRAVAVKVDNTSSKSRPQVGLGVADIVYEVLIEGGRTRFIAVFHSNIPSEIGPVRSARSTDIDLMEDLGGPYFAASGGNPGVLRELRRADDAGTLVDLNGLRTADPYVRVSDRPAPYDFFFRYGELSEHEPTFVEPLFEYGDNPPGARDAGGVTVTFHAYSGTRSSHIWDPLLGGWVRIQDGTLHVLTGDYGEEEAAPANVVVIFTPHKISSADPESPQAASFGSGEALILTAGEVHEGAWERTREISGFRFSDTSGNPLKLSPGPTWVLVANTSRRMPVADAVILSTAEAEALLAEAREAAAAEAAAAAAAGS